MMDRRPIWAMPDWVPREIEARLPEGGSLVVIESETEGSGDGATRVAPEVLAAVADADAYFGYGIPAELLEAGPALRWVHSGAAGVGSSLTERMRAADVVFTNSAGIHAPPMAETVLGMILHFGRGLDVAVAAQRERRWSSEDYYVAGAPLSELSASTVGIIGYGGIGREVARRAASLGARVIATRRSAGAPPELEPLAGGGSLRSSVEVGAGREGLDALLRAADYVVVCAPDTPATRGIIGAAALERMKDSAVLINVARGRLVDEDALVDALRRGRIRGAGLDVFRREPLPAEHPLWALPNVLITPHVSAVTRGYWRRETDLILRNLDRYVSGAPTDSWENVVDMSAGY